LCAFCGGILPAEHRGHPVDNPVVHVSAVVADQPELFHVPERDIQAAASAATYAVVAPPPAVPVAQVVRPRNRPSVRPRRAVWHGSPVVIVNAESEAPEPGLAIIVRG
jgi:hypothetical protein